ncbi:MAG: TROVE domain-containing protein, partial [Actinomycetota bacterium]|nr:TROVE domain-containing protein [Actinomycetota bacterium]
MSKFNTPIAEVGVRSPVMSEVVPTSVTHEGAPGWVRDAKSELYLLAVTNMGAERTFYESAAQRDSRFAGLVRQVAVEDLPWLAGFLPWLRSAANMRTAPLIAAAEAVKARLDAGLPGGSRQLVASVLQRADEPGELLAYWHSHYGRALPKPLKRGIADAILRLYDEYALLKYDTGSHGYRFGDVIELVHVTGEHPEVRGTWKGDLYEHAIDRRHNRDNPVPDSLAMIRANATLRAMAAEDPRALLGDGALKAAGMTWEDVLSLAGSALPKRDVWTALAPTLGYMAALRNLRNMDEAGVPDDVAEVVAARLADPEQVARSRQFPMRFLSAYRAAPSLRWAHPLEKAVNASVASIPALSGRTLVLIDTSLSMNNAFSKDGTLMRWDAAA